MRFRALILVCEVAQCGCVHIPRRIWCADGAGRGYSSHRTGATDRDVPRGLALTET